MKVLIDGVLHNRCPISNEDMPENCIVHDSVRENIFKDLDDVKKCYNGSYYFDLITQEWLTRNEAGKDICKPTKAEIDEMVNREG